MHLLLDWHWYLLLYDVGLVHVVFYGIGHVFLDLKLLKKKKRKVSSHELC